MSNRVKKSLVDAAPHPVHTAFVEGPPQRMAGSLEVLHRMAVLRLVAAAHVPAREAHPQRRPGIAHLDALLTHLRRRLYRLNAVEMLARLGPEGSRPDPPEDHVRHPIYDPHSPTLKLGDADYYVARDDTDGSLLWISLRRVFWKRYVTFGERARASPEQPRGDQDGEYGGGKLCHVAGIGAI